MSQSVKLSDGSYIDASGIYDYIQKQTQEAVNAAVAQLRTEMDLIPLGDRHKRLPLASENTENEGAHIEFTGAGSNDWVHADNYMGYFRIIISPPNSTGTYAIFHFKKDGLYIESSTLSGIYLNGVKKVSA